MLTSVIHKSTLEGHAGIGETVNLQGFYAANLFRSFFPIARFWHLPSCWRLQWTIVKWELDTQCILAKNEKPAHICCTWKSNPLMVRVPITTFIISKETWTLASHAALKKRICALNRSAASPCLIRLNYHKINPAETTMSLLKKSLKWLSI